MKRRVTNLHEDGGEDAIPSAPSRHLEETQHNIALVRSQNEVVRLEQQNIGDTEVATPLDEVGDVVAALERARLHVRAVRHLADVGDVTHSRVLVHEAVHVVGVLTQQRARVELLEEVVDGDGGRVQRVEPLGQVLLHRHQVLVLAPVGAHRLPLERQNDGVALRVDHVIHLHRGGSSIDAAVMSHYPGLVI